MKTYEQGGFQAWFKETTPTLKDNTAEPSNLSTHHRFRQQIVGGDRMTKLKLVIEICSMLHFCLFFQLGNETRDNFSKEVI